VRGLTTIGRPNSRRETIIGTADRLTFPNQERLRSTNGDSILAPQLWNAAQYSVRNAAAANPINFSLSIFDWADFN